MRKIFWTIIYHMSWAYFLAIAVTGMTLYAVSEKDVFTGCPSWSLGLGAISVVCVALFCVAGTKLDKIRIKRFRNALRKKEIEKQQKDEEA